MVVSSPTAGTLEWFLLEAPTGGEQWLPLSHLSSKGFFSKLQLRCFGKGAWQ